MRVRVLPGSPLSTQEKRAKADEIVNLIDNLVTALIDHHRPDRWDSYSYENLKTSRANLRKSIMELL